MKTLIAVLCVFFATYAPIFSQTPSFWGKGFENQGVYSSLDLAEGYHDTAKYPYRYNGLCMHIGPIETSWTPNESGQGFTIHFVKPNQKPLEYCRLERGTSLEEVEAPWNYKFTKPGTSKTVTKSSKDSRGRMTKSVTYGISKGPPRAAWCYLGQVILLKLDNHIVGIEGIKIDLFWRKLPHTVNESLGGKLTFKWRYWSIPESNKIVQRVAQSR